MEPVFIHFDKETGETSVAKHKETLAKAIGVAPKTIYNRIEKLVNGRLETNKFLFTMGSFYRYGSLSE